MTDQPRVRQAARRAWLVALAILATGTATFAAEPPPGAAAVVGRWDLTIHTPDGQTLRPLMQIAWSGDGFTGDYTTTEDYTTLRGFKVEGGEVSFSVSTTYELRPVEATFKATPSGDALQGTLEYEAEGGSGELPFEARRIDKPAWAVPLEAAQVTGRWQARIETDDGNVIEPVITVTESAEGLAGRYDSRNDALGEFAADGVVIDGQRLIVTLSGTVNDRDFEGRYLGTVAGERYEGLASYTIGDESGVLPFEAKRLAPAPAPTPAPAPAASLAASDVVGRWRLRVDTEDGNTITPALVLSAEGDKITAIYESGFEQLGDIAADLVTIEADRMRVNISGELNDLIFFIEYDGRVRDGAYSGDVVYEFGENTGKAKFVTESVTRPPAGSLAGRWDLRVFNDEGLSEDRGAVISLDGGRASIAYISPLGNRDATDVETSGETIAFTVTGELEGRQMVSRYSGRLEDGRLVGTVEYRFGEDRGTVRFTGTRSAD